MDGVLKMLVTTGGLAVVVIAPDVLQSLNKPFGKFMKTMDRRQQQREVQRVLYYMKQQKLISGSYNHGLKITSAGKRKLKSLDIERVEIPRPKTWDKKWRLVFFDIPESHKVGRDALTRKLKALGFYPLQRSVLVHPFPCKEQIEAITGTYQINQFVSYIETSHIDQSHILVKKFASLL